MIYVWVCKQALGIYAMWIGKNIADCVSENELTYCVLDMFWMMFYMMSYSEFWLFKALLSQEKPKREGNIIFQSRLNGLSKNFHSFESRRSGDVLYYVAASSSFYA